MNLNCYILVRSVVLCYIGHKWSVSVNSRTLILVIQCNMFWFNETSFIEPKHVALDGNIIVLSVTVIIILYLMWLWCIVRVMLIGENRSTRTENYLTVAVPLYRLSLCHFTDCHCANLPTVTVPLYRLSLCHFTDWHCTTLTFFTVALHQLSLCHFTDWHCISLTFVTVAL